MDNKKRKEVDKISVHDFQFYIKFKANFNVNDFFFVYIYMRSFYL
jgi:hypothetical protein